jgi:type VI secretion system Hcp family effector
MDLRSPRCPSRSRRSPALLGLLLLALFIPSAHSADILVQMQGIPGESTAPGHAGWIDAFAMSHGASRASVTNTANHYEVAFTKRLDSASPILCDHLNQVTVIPVVQIEFMGQSPTYIQFYKMTLTGARLSSVAYGGWSGGEPTENVSFYYEQIAWSYTQVAPQGNGMPAYTATWNLTNSTGTYSTNLLDTDFDGLPNAYESANGLNPNVNDANGDLDHDGLTNYQEFRAGTNPNDFNSVFRVTRINLASGQVRITWNSVAGRTYTISAASQVNGPYLPVRNVTSAGTGETSTDFTPSPARQFYRVATP